jgi:Ca2+-binding EF-hand superfamily protein
MKLATTIVLAAVAITIGLAYAADDKKEPGFNVLDKNNDGYLTRTEAVSDSDLAKKFKDADKNGDGKISRAEYLAVKTRKDLNTAKAKVEKAVQKDDKPASTGATK